MRTRLCLVFLQAILVLHQWNTAEAKAELRGLEDEHVPNEYLVVIQGSHETSEQGVRKDLKRLQVFIDNVKAIGNGAGIVHKDTVVYNSLGVLHVHVTSRAALDLLLDHPLVAFVETNKIVRINEDQRLTAGSQCTREDTGATLWGLSRISSRTRPDYGTAGYQHSSQAENGVEAYVIDTGVFTEHPRFQNRSTRGFTAPALFQSEGDKDLHGHGTHVAGTIGASFYGVSPGVKIIAVKVLGGTGSGTIMDILHGVKWTCRDFEAKTEARGKRGAKGVVNMSLGSRAMDVLDMIIRSCVDKSDLTFVVAAGNDASDACTYSPARSSSIITVGATNIRDEVAYFSNYGPCVDILAPGENITSTWIGQGSNQLNTISGTSMASPHVAGAVANLLADLPEQPTPPDLKAILLDASTKDKINVAFPTFAMMAPNRFLYSSCNSSQGMQEWI